MNKNDKEKEQLILSGIAIATAAAGQVMEDHWGFQLSERKLFVSLVQERILEAVKEHDKKQPA